MNRREFLEVLGVLGVSGVAVSATGTAAAASLSDATLAHAQKLIGIDDVDADGLVVSCNPLSCDISKFPPRCDVMTCKGVTCDIEGDLPCRTVTTKPSDPTPTQPIKRL
ncbi:MAG: hypothetical protein EP330_04055 [Deltaproteobacteria bacterium]|nr:MAG: hypothetical protein EP330_04055 [Deltaproteobacteria bacterium]